MIAIHFLLTLTPLSHFTFLIKNRKIMFNFTILNEIGFLKHNIKTSKGNMHEVCNNILPFIYMVSIFSPRLVEEKVTGPKNFGPNRPKLQQHSLSFQEMHVKCT